MAKKKKRKPNRTFHSKHRDCHHICWQRRFWTKPQAKQLRNLFTETINVDLHHYIHANLNNIPTPPEEACREAIKRFDGKIEGLLPKIVWLAENVDYAPFQEAMWRQYEVVISYKKPHN